MEDTIAVIGIFFNQGIATFLAEGEYDSSKRIILFGMFLQLFVSQFILLREIMKTNDNKSFIKKF